jgi:hypothetical protein
VTIVKAAGVCGTEWRLIKRDRPGDRIPVDFSKERVLPGALLDMPCEVVLWLVRREEIITFSPGIRSWSFVPTQEQVSLAMGAQLMDFAPVIAYLIAPADFEIVVCVGTGRITWMMRRITLDIALSNVAKLVDYGVSKSVTLDAARITFGHGMTLSEAVADGLAHYRVDLNAMEMMEGVSVGSKTVVESQVSMTEGNEEVHLPSQAAILAFG